MSTITFEIPQRKHPFIGMGDGIIVTENGRMEPKVTIRFPKHNIEITVGEGDEAKAMIAHLNSDEYYNNRSKTSMAIDIACKILDLEPHMLQLKTKEEKIVFARWMVWKYCVKTLGMSLTECGEMFGLDHSTVIHGVDKLSIEKLKYLSPWQASAYREFRKKIEEKYSDSE